MPNDLRTRIAAAIYAGVMESCDGYVEGQESGYTVDPTDPTDALVVDGRITFTVVADAVIRELGLPMADLVADAILAELRLRLAAFARDCVLHGDMTPAAERMLLRILSDMTLSSDDRP